MYFLSSLFQQQVFLVGRRTNIFAPFPVITSSRQANDHSIHQASRQGVLFQTDAEDYFIFTKHCFDWKEIKPVVIGRPGYDNYLVNYVYYHGDTISFLDVTNSLIVLHQTVTDRLLTLLAQKIKGNAGVSAIYTTIAGELNRYVTNGYLSTDKVWTDTTKTLFKCSFL